MDINYNFIIERVKVLKYTTWRRPSISMSLESIIVLTIFIKKIEK